ncbi:hypothetical protein CPB86DRAFT_783944 [Serendipita vermifera]|nr:hypothetical protein CPB86DRAFT_783944 [Serendipita vermifera]
MRSSLLRAASAAQARKPLIHFLGKRPKPSTVHAEEHHPHPASPPEIQEAFKSLFKQWEEGGSKVQASQQRRDSAGGGFESAVAGANGSEAAKKASDPTSSTSYGYFWEAPIRVWKSVEMTEKEIESVMMGGAP